MHIFTTISEMLRMSAFVCSQTNRLALIITRPKIIKIFSFIHYFIQTMFSNIFSSNFALNMVGILIFQLKQNYRVQIWALFLNYSIITLSFQSLILKQWHKIGNIHFYDLYFEFRKFTEYHVLPKDDCHHDRCHLQKPM